MSRFTDYVSRVDAGASHDWKIQLLGESGAILASNDIVETDQGGIEWGAKIRPLAHQAARVSNKTATITIPDPDGLFMPDQAGTLLHPDSGNRVRIWAGVEDALGEMIWWVQSTMLPLRVSGTMDRSVRTVEVSLVDMLRPLRSQTLELFSWSDGEAVETVVGRMLDQVFDEYTIAATGFTTPSGSIKPGSDRARFVVEMLEGCGHEITTTPLGEVVTRKILSSADDGGEKWKYGPDGLPVHSASREWSTKTPQAWRVEGGSFQNRDDPIETTVYDTDPSSEGFYDGRTAAQVESSRFQWIKTNAQAAEAGYGQLRRNGVGPMVVRFQSIPNPALRENDLVDLEVEELNASGIFRVQEFELPVQVDGRMNVTARKVYDPQVNYRPPIEVVDGCRLDEFSDDFNRPDQNLENTLDGGSVEWMEFGYSFNIRNGLCVQLNEAWCLAVHTRPICSSDVYSQITISRIPSGKYLGPAVGSSGGFECYAAVIDSSGIMRLEKWQGGKKIHQFGQASIGSPAGKSAWVQRVGTTITAGVGASTLLTADHSGLRGTYIGLIGAGGWGADGPAASNYVGGPV